MRREMKSQERVSEVSFCLVGLTLAPGMQVSGSIKCWGANSEGQLGLGDTNNRGDGPGEMGVISLSPA
jgi:hypothetical protein